MEVLTKQTALSLDSDLSGEQHYPHFEQPGPDVYDFDLIFAQKCNPFAQNNTKQLVFEYKALFIAFNMKFKSHCPPGKDKLPAVFPVMFYDLFMSG